MHSNTFTKVLDGNGLGIAIVRARFNDEITENLLKGAMNALLKTGVQEEDISVAEVPGSFEIPIVAQKYAETGNYDAIITLGAIIKGDTPHFDYVCKAVTDGVLQVNLDYGIPVTFGVITTNNKEQAIERSADNESNVGYSAAMAAIEMVETIRKIEEA